MMSRGLAALVAMTLVVAACGDNNDDINGVQEIVGGGDASAPATDAASSQIVPDDSSNPAATSVIVEDDSTAVGEELDDPRSVLEREGVVFTGSTGDYTVTFPGQPTGTPLPIELPTGPITAEAFIYEQGFEAAFFTSAFDYPDGVTDDDPEVVLTGARDGAISNVGATLSTSEFIESDGVPGVMFTFDVADGAQSGVGAAVIFFDAPRLWQTFALGETEFMPNYQAFVDTFTFTGAGS